MDIHGKQRELFFNNLLILEFDKSEVEKKYKLKCERDMFCLPNQKMFEIVTNFLFKKLNDISEKQYSLPWPLLDRKQCREFQKATVDYLSSIAQESNIRFPRIVPSVVASFSGDHFYEIYLAFSSHVVEKTIRKNDNVSLIARPSISKHNSQDVVETLKIVTISSVEKLQEIQHLSLKSYMLFLKTSNYFTTHIQKLKSSLATNSSLLKEKNEFLESSCDSADIEKPIEYRIQAVFERAKKVKKHWEQVQEYLEKEKKFWDYLYPVIKETPETLLLEEAYLKFDIKDPIKAQSSDLNKICSEETQEQISLLKYLKIYSLVLNLYEKVLLKGDLLQTKEVCDAEKMESFDSYITELNTLHEKLLTAVASMKENNEILQNRFLEEVSEDLQIFTKECSSWNFSSKSFQDEVNNSRLLFTSNITDDGLKTSLFANDSGLDSCDWKTEDFSCSSNSVDCTSAKQDISSIEVASSIEAEVFLSSVEADDYDSFNETMPTKLLNTLKKDRSKPLDTFASDMPQLSRTDTENSIPTRLSHEKGLIFDIDLDYHRNLKIRESWNLVESLDSVTLPETSFTD